MRTENHAFVEVELAAIALFDLAGLEAVSGTLMHKGREKTSYLLESEAGFFVVSGYELNREKHIQSRVEAIMSAMAWASRRNISPQPLTIDGRFTHLSERHIWAGYAFVDGSLLMQSRSPVEIYGRLGEVAATLHSSWSPDELRSPPELGDRLRNTVVPEGVREGIQRALSGRSSKRLLHGDLNASNVVLAGFPMVIDFDDCGIGIPELELAISLGYVNTSPADIRNCFQSMVSRYIAQSPDLDLKILGKLCGYIPWYLAA